MHVECVLGTCFYLASQIVHGKRGIRPDTVLRLARYFGTSERFWLNLQGRYELEVERDRSNDTLEEIEPFATGCRRERNR